MRVTNAMTTNQLLLDLNKSMNALSFLQYQSETGNKIRYASDDPIIATRALKFRTSLTETEQYLSNVDQGKSWLTSTANPVKNILEALVNSGETSIRSLLVSGANGTNTIADSKIYANQMKETLREMLSELNTTYAGRYLFSGLKTDEKCVFNDDVPGLKMDITQGFSVDEIETDYKYYVKATTTDMPEEISIIRLKLPYESDILATSIRGLTPQPTGVDSTAANAYLPADGAIHYIEDTGELIFGKDAYAALFDAGGILETQKADYDAEATASITDLKHVLNDLLPNIKDAATANDAITALKALYNSGNNPPTGRLVDMLAEANGNPLDLLSPGSVKSIEDAMAAIDKALVSANKVLNSYNNNVTPAQSDLSDLEKYSTAAFNLTNTAVKAPDSGTLHITYTKDGFNEYELNPKAYFDCTDLATGKSYTMNSQEMEYEFGVGSRMQINTLGKDVLTTNLLNDIYDAISLVEGVKISDKDELVAYFKSGSPPIADSDEEAIKMAEAQITDEEKFYQDMITQKYTDLIGKIDKHAEGISEENTSIGARISRLELTSNRLLDDRINFEELKVNNENVDMAEAYIRYQSMYSVYQSALQMGAKVVQMTLVNFI